MRAVILFGLILALSSGGAACSPFEPATYDYGLSFTNTQRGGWPVWIEEVEFERGEERWRSSAGSVGGGAGTIPPQIGKVAQIGPLPVPETMWLRWFSNRTQKYYEADLVLPKDAEAQMKQWFKRFPLKEEYGHYLNIVVGGDGEVMVWWGISCRKDDESRCGFDACLEYRGRQMCHYYAYPLIRSARGREAAGDPNKYSTDTEQYRREGEFP